MSDATTLLLSALYGFSATNSIGTGNPVTALAQAERTQSSQIAQEAQQPAVARAISAFTAAVSSATNAATLLQNPSVLEVLLTANGLGDQVAYPALAQKALLSDASDPASLANQLSNTAWKATAATYNFATQGLSVIQQASVIASITSGYAEVKWRQSLDAATPGLSNALSFIDKAATATSVDAVLGDSTLRTVVTTALGIPPQIAFQDIEAQENAVGSRLDISKLQDPQFVQNMARQYLLQTQAANASSTSPPSLEQLAVQGAGLLV